jgi:hypothetical protein
MPDFTVELLKTTTELQNARVTITAESVQAAKTQAYAALQMNPSAYDNLDWQSDGMSEESARIEVLHAEIV